MRSITLCLFLTIMLLANCTAKRFDGVYAGELGSEKALANGAAMPADGENLRETDLSVKVRQTGERISVKIARSRLLGDCELVLKIGKNGTAYLETPQTCTQSLPLEGTLDLQDDELNCVLRGFDATSSTTFRFKGYRK